MQATDPETRTATTPMKRRTFLAGTGLGAIGTTALVASGAFSGATSQRHTKIEIVQDPEAYLAMDACEDHDDVEVGIDDAGHVEIEADGTASSVRYFDSVLEVCNYGKDPVGVWIEVKQAYEPYEDEDRVQFYVEDDPDNRVDSEEDAYELDVGKCVCIGIRADGRGLEDTQLIANEAVVVHADVGLVS